MRRTYVDLIKVEIFHVSVLNGRFEQRAPLVANFPVTAFTPYYVSQLGESLIRNIPNAMCRNRKSFFVMMKVTSLSLGLIVSSLSRWSKYFDYGFKKIYSSPLSVYCVWSVSLIRFDRLTLFEHNKFFCF